MNKEQLMAGILGAALVMISGFSAACRLLTSSSDFGFYTGMVLMIASIVAFPGISLLLYKKYSKQRDEESNKNHSDDEQESGGQTK